MKDFYEWCKRKYYQNGEENQTDPPPPPPPLPPHSQPHLCYMRTQNVLLF